MHHLPEEEMHCGKIMSWWRECDALGNVMPGNQWSVNSSSTGEPKQYQAGGFNIVAERCVCACVCV